jgi:uncharacterized membrane protein
MSQTMIIRLILAICFIIYPFIVYFGIRILPPGFFGLVLTVLLVLRFGVLLPQERLILLPVLIIFTGYAVVITLLKNTQMLLFYPALVNFCLCAVFTNSLWHEESLLLRIVRARGAVISEYTPQYLFRLTALWAVFFALNGMIALWTSTVSMEVWTLYNGLISYFIIAALIGAELLFRTYYKKRMDKDSR